MRAYVCGEANETKTTTRARPLQLIVVAFVTLARGPLQHNQNVAQPLRHPSSGPKQFWPVNTVRTPRNAMHHDEGRGTHVLSHMHHAVFGGGRGGTRARPHTWHTAAAAARRPTHHTPHHSAVGTFVAVEGHVGEPRGSVTQVDRIEPRLMQDRWGEPFDVL